MFLAILIGLALVALFLLALLAANPHLDSSISSSPGSAHNLPRAPDAPRPSLQGARPAVEVFTTDDGGMECW